jgi:hypothetical protein
MGNSIAGLVFQPPEVTYMNAEKHIIWLNTASGYTIPAFYINRRYQIPYNFILVNDSTIIQLI